MARGGVTMDGALAAVPRFAPSLPAPLWVSERVCDAALLGVRGAVRCARRCARLGVRILVYSRTLSNKLRSTVPVLLFDASL